MFKKFKLVFQGWQLARFRVCSKSEVCLIALPFLFPLNHARNKNEMLMPATQGKCLRRKANQIIFF